jgi:HK97 family phage major capsid protein
VPSMTATDYRNLLPVDVASEVIGLIEQKSAVMQASKVIRMSTNAVSLPLAAATPSARFVNQFGIGLSPADLTARKPFGEIQWSTQKAVAEEISVVTAVPDAFLADAGFDVWGDVRTRLASEIAMELDRVMLNGTNAPATYPVGGLAAAATAAVGTGPTDLAEILGAWANVAANGGQVNAGVSSPAGVAFLFGMVDETGRPLYLSSLSAPQGATPSLLGSNVYPTRAWNITGANMIVGDFDYSIVGMRQDITWDTSNDGVITDAAGKVLISAFQDDMTIIRMYARVAYAIGTNMVGSTPKAPFARINLGDTV